MSENYQLLFPYANLIFKLFPDILESDCSSFKIGNYAEINNFNWRQCQQKRGKLYKVQPGCGEEMDKPGYEAIATEDNSIEA